MVGLSMPETEFMIQRAKNILAVRQEDDMADDPAVIRGASGRPVYRVPINVSYNNKHEFTVNTVRWSAHPAGHYDSIRAKPKMMAILGDEIAFFVKKKQAQQAIRDAFEHYRGGADTIVSLVTTSGEAPIGFAFDIFQEPSAQKPTDPGYRHYILGVEAGLEIHPESKTSLYNKTVIDSIRGTSEYKRNYEHQWGADKGNIWSFEQVESASKLSYLPGIQLTGVCSMGIDPAYGSSKFAILVSQLNGKIQVLAAEEYDRADMNDMVKTIMRLIYEFKVQKIFIDSSDPAIIRALKRLLGERPDYDKQIDQYPDNYHHIMKVVPVGFRRNTLLEKNSMLSHAQQLVSDGNLQIDPSFTDLISQMRAAKTKEDGRLDKDDGFTMDLVDALFLSLRHFKYGKL